MSDLLKDSSFNAGRVIELAKEETKRLNHRCVGVESLLLGLIKLNEGVAVSVLREYGVNLDRLRRKVEEKVGVGSNPSDNIWYDPKFFGTLSLASKEARDLNDNHVGTEHILLSLLSQRGSVIEQVFADMGLGDPETLRKMVFRKLNLPDPSVSVKVGEVHEPAGGDNEPTVQELGAAFIKDATHFFNGSPFCPSGDCRLGWLFNSHESATIAYLEVLMAAGVDCGSFDKNVVLGLVKHVTCLEQLLVLCKAFRQIFKGGPHDPVDWLQRLYNQMVPGSEQEEAVALLLRGLTGGPIRKLSPELDPFESRGWLVTAKSAEGGPVATDTQ